MRAQHGFTYLGLLLAIALLGLGLTTASELWTTTAHRQRLEQLEWVGQQYAQAIGSYYEATPGRVKSFPRSLDDLVEDKRFAFKRRHLRRVYANPLTGRREWDVVTAPDGGIRCVRTEVSALGIGEARTRVWCYDPGVSR